MESDINELNEINRNMIASIRTLEQDNKAYYSELCQLRVKIEHLQMYKSPTTLKENILNKSACDVNFEPRTPASSQQLMNPKRTRSATIQGSEVGAVIARDQDQENSPKEINKKNNILILCDDQFGFVVDSIRAKFCNYDVLSIVKPNAFFKDVISDVLNLTKSFTLDDYVILHAGYNDVQNGRAPYFGMINGLLKHCTHTNIILTTVSYSYVKNKNIHLMYKFNLQLFNYANALNRYAEGTVVCVDINDAKGLMHGRYVIIDKLLCSTQCKLKNGNLIFIRPLESTPTLNDQANIKVTAPFLDNPPQS